MNILDLHVLPSNGEGFPNVVAESMCCGIINIARDVGDSNIIISDKHKTGVAGIHVDRNTGKNSITVVRGAPSSLTINEIDAEKALEEGNHEKALEKYKEAEDIYRALKMSMQAQTLGEDVGIVFTREMIVKRRQMPKFSPSRFVSKIAHLSTGYGEKVGNIRTNQLDSRGSPQKEELLAGLFAISGYSGKASGRFFGPF